MPGGAARRQYSWFETELSFELGFRTHLLLDGCRGVDLNPGDVDRAIEELQAVGVYVTDSAQAIESMGR